MLYFMSQIYHMVELAIDLVSIGQNLKLKFPKLIKKQIVSASVKALTEDPYENIDKKYKINCF